MKAKPPSILDSFMTKKFMFVTLYLADLERIFELATARGYGYEITDTENIYDNLNDLRDSSAPRLHELTLRFGKDGRFSEGGRLKLTRKGVEIYADRNDEILPLWFDLTILLKKRGTEFSLAYNPWTWWFVMTAAALLPIDHARFVELGYVKLGIMSVSLLFFAAAAYAALTTNIIHLRKQHEVETFLSKHGATLALLVIGGAVTIGFQWIYERFLK